MLITTLFPHKYLKPGDIKSGSVVTIDQVATEVMGEKQELKPVIHFTGLPKPAVLNKTNGATLAAAFGDDSADWAGRQVELSVIKVRKPGGGGLVDSICMTPAKSKFKSKEMAATDDPPVF